jgi:hypothetical protein
MLAASAVLVTGGYVLLVLSKADHSVDAFKMKDGGVDKPVYMSIFLCVSVAGLAGDGAQMLLRGWLLEQLQLEIEGPDGTVPPPQGPWDGEMGSLDNVVMGNGGVIGDAPG